MVRDQFANVSTDDVRAFEDEAPTFDSLSEMPARLGGAVGAKIEQFTLFPKIYLLKQAAPIVQSLLLMLLYATLPFILLFSSYSIATVITTSIILFAIKFLSVLWAMARWLDTHLQEALLIGTGRNDAGSRIFDFFVKDGLFDTLSEDVLELTLAILFVVAPLVWVFALGLAGITVVRSISSFIDQATKPAGSAGEKGGGAAVGLAKKEAGKLGK
ncbi:MAG: conjugal transfer protein TraG N-terminal domain-containing protein [Blastocatellia bacterium]